MKTLQTLCIILLIILLFCPGRLFSQTNTFPSTGSVGIGTTTPDASAILEMVSTSQGVLITRMTKAQRDAISSPANGLLIYQSNNTPGFYYYDGTSWSAVTPKSANRTLSNLSAPTAVNVDLLPGFDNATDIGSVSNSWRDIYLDGSLYLGGVKYLTNSSKGNTFIGETGNTTNIGGSNTFLGKHAGKSNTSGFWNTMIGDTAGMSNTTGRQNVFIGYKAGSANIDGDINTAVGSFALYSNLSGYNNCAFGENSLFLNTTGSLNSAFGTGTLSQNTTGNSNSAFGQSTLGSNTTGTANSAYGHLSMSFNTTGYNNCAVGDYSLTLNTTGFRNCAFGSESMYSNTIGIDNSAMGYVSLYNNTTGFYNAAFGSYCLYENTTGNYNSAFGGNSLVQNTTGSSNAALGYGALQYNLSGIDNSAFGYQSLNLNSGGDYNSAFGHQALYSNTTGLYNSAVGMGSLYSNTTAWYNSALGYHSLYSNTTGSYDVAVGNQALSSNTTASSNTGIGYSSLSGNTTGAGNTALGILTGNIRTANSYCTFVGYDADNNTGSNFSNSIALGNISRITASNQVRIGNPSVTSIGGYADWSNISDGRFKKNVKENVPGLEFINLLRPVTYILDAKGIDHFLQGGVNEKIETADDATRKALEVGALNEKESIICSGFIAQEVEKSAKSLGYDFNGVDAPKNENDLYGLRYAEFVVPLVKAVQELDKENARLLDGQGKLKMDNSGLQKDIEELKLAVGQLQSSIENPDKNIGRGQESSMTDGYAKLQTSSIKLQTLLGQNIPNPFDNSTLIPFRIPKDCQDASIMITNTSTSEVLLVIPVSCNEDHVSIDAGVLAGGTYSYSLYVDGKLIDTKSMVLLR